MNLEYEAIFLTRFLSTLLFTTNVAPNSGDKNVSYRSQHPSNDCLCASLCKVQGYGVVPPI